MNARHLQFCLNYLQTNDPGVAYKMTYPKANNNSVYASASRLMARPDVSTWIKETQERVHDRALRAMEEEMGGVLKNQLLTINQKRAVLTKVITGETKRVRHIKTKYSYEKVEDDLPIYAVLRAIDMDTRLENFYNYLSNPDTWRKTHNQYVNTPTLQQQVNILISQTTRQNENKNEHQELSPAGGGVRQSSDGGACPTEQPFGRGPLAQENIHRELSLAGGDVRQSSDGGACPTEQPFGRGPLAQENTHQEQLTPGVSVPSRLNSTRKTPHYLTILNNFRPSNPQTSVQTIPDSS